MLNVPKKTGVARPTHRCVLASKKGLDIQCGFVIITSSLVQIWPLAPFSITRHHDRRLLDHTPTHHFLSLAADWQREFWVVSSFYDDQIALFQPCLLGFYLVYCSNFISIIHSPLSISIPPYAFIHTILQRCGVFVYRNIFLYKLKYREHIAENFVSSHGVMFFIWIFLRKYKHQCINVLNEIIFPLLICDY